MYNPEDQCVRLVAQKLQLSLERQAAAQAGQEDETELAGVVRITTDVIGHYDYFKGRIDEQKDNDDRCHKIPNHAGPGVPEEALIDLGFLVIIFLLLTIISQAIKVVGEALARPHRHETNNSGDQGKQDVSGLDWVVIARAKRLRRLGQPLL